MKINRNLNLVIPLETDSNGKIYIHSVAINREIFELFYLELGRVFSQCFDSANDLHLVMSAPQLAYPALKTISKKMNTWDGKSGVQDGLINEIVRLTNVLINKDKSWETLPYDLVVKQGIITEDEEREVLSSLIFFTVISRVAAKDLRVSFLEMVASLRNWQITSLDCTAYRNSLPILTTGVSIGEKVA